MQPNTTRVEYFLEEKCPPTPTPPQRGLVEDNAAITLVRNTHFNIKFSRADDFKINIKLSHPKVEQCTQTTNPDIAFGQINYHKLQSKCLNTRVENHDRILVHIKSHI